MVDFLDAIQLARRSRPTVLGVVAGDGPELELARRHPAVSRGAVVALGHRSDVRELLEAADAACLLGEREGLPLSILEALAAGVPVVASRIPGNEAVLGTDAGLLADVSRPDEAASAIVLLADSRKLRDALADRGRRLHASSYSADAMVRAYADLVENWPLRRAGVRKGIERRPTIQKGRADGEERA